MKKIVRLTESDIVRLVKKVLKEQNPSNGNLTTGSDYFQQLQAQQKSKADFLNKTTEEYTGYCERLHLKDKGLRAPDVCRNYQKMNTDVTTIRKCFTDIRKLKDEPKMTQVQKDAIETFVRCTSFRLGQLP